MENVQSSVHFNENNDPASLEGLDDFLEGLLDKVFDPDVEQTDNVRALRVENKDVEKHDTNDNDMSIDDLFEKDPNDIISDAAGLFSPSIIGKSSSSTPSIFEADPDQTVELELKIRFLEAQLDYRNKELRDSFNRLKFMEGQILAKDDQLKMVPELIKRGALATKYEYELESLKDNLEAVSSELRDTQHVLENMRGNWIGRLSLWLSKKNKEEEIA